jgi:DNA-binding HxlR family transcriptional regulator
VKRGYEQWCAVAKALDVLGGRWTLLLVRELLGGPRRFRDLADALPGIGTNLLSDRLRLLGDEGVVEKRKLPPPAGSSVYVLTQRGNELGSVIDALAQWGTARLGGSPSRAGFRVYWLLLAAKTTFDPEHAGDLQLTVEVRASDEDLAHYQLTDGRLNVFQGPASDADVVVTGSPADLIELFQGRLAAKAAIANGLELEGDFDSLERLLVALDIAPGSFAPGRGA